MEQGVRRILTPRLSGVLMWQKQAALPEAPIYYKIVVGNILFLAVRGVMPNVAGDERFSVSHLL